MNIRKVICFFYSDASDLLTEILTPVNEVEREDWIDKILDSVQKQTCKYITFFTVDILTLS